MDDEVRIEILHAFREGRLEGEREAWRAAILVVSERFPELDKLQAANKLLEALVRVEDVDHGLSPAPFVIEAHLAKRLHEEARELMLMPDRLLGKIVGAWLEAVRATEVVAQSNEISRTEEKAGHQERLSLEHDNTEIILSVRRG